MSVRFPRFTRSSKQNSSQQSNPYIQSDCPPVSSSTSARSKCQSYAAHPRTFSPKHRNGNSSRPLGSPRALRYPKTTSHASLPVTKRIYNTPPSRTIAGRDAKISTSVQFKHPLYQLTQDGKITFQSATASTETDTAKHREEMSNVIIQHVHTVMKFELQLHESYIPASSSENANRSRAKIFVSENYENSEKLLVFVATSRGLAPGVWSRGLLLQAGIHAGSMIPYLKQAIKEGYGIIIMNPNKNFSFNANKTQRIHITGSSTPEEHARSVWDLYIRPTRARRVYFIGFAQGGVLIKHLLKVRGNELAKRNGAIAFIESSHRVHNEDTKSIKAILKHRSLYWESSEMPFKQVLQGDAPHRTGCTCISSGLPPRMHANPYQRAAYCIDKIRISLFQYLAIRDVKLYLSEALHAETAPPKIALTSKNCEQEVSVPRNDRTASTDSRDTCGQKRNCTLCCIQFTLFDRRHHCRMCRQAVCNSCSRDRVFIPGSSTAQRVCIDCACKTSAATSDKKSSGSTIEPYRKHSNDSGNKSDDNISSPENQVVQQHQHAKLCVDDFDLLKVVGKGAFGKVMLVRKKVHDGVGNPNAIYAMKVLKKAAVFAQNQVEHTKSERRILRDIDHPFVVRLRYAFQSENKLYLVMDYYNGGSLFFHLRKSRKFPEKQAKFYAAQLVLSMAHLHEYNIAYRDLKLENILMDSEGFIALTDFGLSKENVDVPDGAKTFCGTAEYIAPELLKGLPYGKAVDWWGFGTLLYEMITGQTPFYDRNRKRMFQNILHREVIFTPAFSEDAKDLLLKLLSRDPAKRLGSGPHGAQEIMDHPFFASIDFDKLLKRELEPPFVPLVKSVACTTNVANVFKNEIAKDSPVTQELGATQRAIGHFEGFTYMPSPQVLS